jgi:hypothetical protein
MLMSAISGLPFCSANCLVRNSIVGSIEGVHVPAPVDVLGPHPRVAERLAGETAHRDLEDLVVPVELVVLEGVVAIGVAALAQVHLRELVLVDDHDAARLHIVDVRLEGGRVHRHEGVDHVPGRVDVGAREVDLEAGDAVGRPARCSDLRREVREGRDVVPEEGARAGELGSRQLHAVAGIADEAHRDTLELGRCWVGEREIRSGHAGLHGPRDALAAS